MALMGDGGGNELAEERIRLQGTGGKFGVELAGDEKGMRGQFNDLSQFLLGVDTAEDKARRLVLLFEPVVEFVAMAMALLDVALAIAAVG